MSFSPLKVLGKEILAILLYRVALNPVGLNRKCKHPNIIYYHSVCDFHKDPLRVPDLAISLDNFEKQMEFIREEFNVLPLYAIVEKAKKGEPLSYKDIAITFDDGYLDNYTYAYPILKRHGLPATIFLTTGYIGSNALFWWDKLPLILHLLRSMESELRSLPSHLFTKEIKDLLGKASVKGADLTPLTDYLKSIGAKKRGEVIELIEEKLHETDSKSFSRQSLFLTWKEIKEMSANGISFGSHTHTHPVLTEIKDEDIVKELNLSKELVREHIGSEVIPFSYPDGCINDRVKRYVIEAGYSYAVQTNRYVNRDSTDIFAIRRRMVKESHSKGYFNRFSGALFAMEISGTVDTFFFRDFRRKNPYKNN